MNRHDEARCDRKRRSSPCACWHCSPASRRRKHQRLVADLDLDEQLQEIFEAQEYHWDVIDDGMDTDGDEWLRLRWLGRHEQAAALCARIESGACDKTLSAFPDLIRQIRADSVPPTDATC